ncbi:MAG: hypothetical protein IT371_00540 [Deltaproteobacteria bacterium]|nr:hypothetical protein [Deltaproteobacteria bacterium]
MARMFTREAITEGLEACNTDPAHLERAKLMSGTVVLRALDTPDGKDVLVTYTFDKGRCTKWVFEEEPAPSALRNRPFVPMKDGLARVTAAYQTFVKLDKGEMEPADAMNSPDYKIEANMMMILPLMQAVDSWNRKIRSIPKEY